MVRKFAYETLEVECYRELEEEMVFCNCSIMIGVHDKNCPNYNKPSYKYEWYIDILTDAEGELRKYRFHVDRVEEINIKDKDDVR